MRHWILKLLIIGHLPGFLWVLPLLGVMFTAVIAGILWVANEAGVIEAFLAPPPNEIVYKVAEDIVFDKYYKRATTFGASDGWNPTHHKYGQSKLTWHITHSNLDHFDKETYIRPEITVRGAVWTDEGGYKRENFILVLSLTFPGGDDWAARKEFIDSSPEIREAWFRDPSNYTVVSFTRDD